MGLNFGVFGSGAVFNLCHGPALSNIKNVKIKSIFDVDKSRAKEAADKWKIDNVVSEHDDIINDDEIFSPPVVLEEPITEEVFVH